MNFLLPSYAEAKAQAMVCMLSPPIIRNHVRCDPTIRALLDNEVVEWGKSCLLNLGVDHWVLKPFVWFDGWVESSNTMFHYFLGVRCIQSFPSYCLFRWRFQHPTLVTYLMD
jgi:hypothetical protein